MKKGRNLLVMSLVLAVSASLALAAPTASELQTMRQGLLLCHSRDAGRIASASQLLPLLEQLKAKYGADYEVRAWQPGKHIPDQFKALDLTDEAAVTAYRRAYNAASPEQRKQMPLLLRDSLGWVVAELHSMVGLANASPADLEAATTWVERYVEQKQAEQKEGQWIAYGIPGFYFTCRSRLVALGRQITPIALFGTVPVRLVNTESGIALPVTGLPIPKDEIHWQAQAKTVLLGQTKSVQLTAGESYALVKGRRVELNTPPLLKDGHLLISVRDVKPLFRLDYKWDSRLRAVRIFPPRTNS